jgi:hypothetical protein
MSIANQISSPIILSTRRREFLSGLIASIGVAAILDLSPTSEALVNAIQENAVKPEELMDDITPIQKEIRRLMGIAEYIQKEVTHSFSEKELIALAISAGCAFSLVAEGSGTVLKPKHKIQAKRLMSGRISVYEDGNFCTSLG